MKKVTIILTSFIAISIKTNAQIPNNGFENWTTIGSYMDPDGWGTPNSYSTGSFYAVTRDTSHYPSSIGNYSIRIESNIALINNEGLGLTMSGNQLSAPSPSFSITGHPNSLTGYYKFAPQNGDTMRIQINLYQNGVPVSDGRFTGTASASSWTSFNIPLSNYTTADSAHILLAAYNANGAPPAFVPHGNSVLNVDNLNFDNLITSVQEQVLKTITFNLYPNPTTDFVIINFNSINNEELTLNIYNTMGELVGSELLTQNQQQINIGNLNNGVYMVEIKSKEWTEKQKFIIQR